MPTKIFSNKCKFCAKELKFGQKHHICPANQPDEFHRHIFGYKWHSNNCYEIISYGIECRDPECQKQREDSQG